MLSARCLSYSQPTIANGSVVAQAAKGIQMQGCDAGLDAVVSHLNFCRICMPQLKLLSHGVAPPHCLYCHRCRLSWKAVESVPSMDFPATLSARIRLPQTKAHRCCGRRGRTLSKTSRTPGIAAGAEVFAKLAVPLSGVRMEQQACRSSLVYVPMYAAHKCRQHCQSARLCRASECIVASR